MKSQIEKDKRNRLLFKKYEVKRRFLKYVILNKFIKNTKTHSSNLMRLSGYNIDVGNVKNEKETSLLLYNEEYKKLQKLPRNSSITRIRNRCVVSGRSRGILKDLKMSRIIFRQYALHGMLPGIKKSSC